MLHANGSALMRTAEHAPHRHAARAEHVRVRAVLQRVLRVASACPAATSSTPTSRAAISIAKGAGRGAIDPCFPAKIGVAHVHNLLFVKHAKKKLDYIFFPMVDVLHTLAEAPAGRPTRVRPSP